MSVFTVEEVAEIQKVHPNTVRDWIKSGKLRAKNICSVYRNIYRVTQEELDRFNLPNSGRLPKSVRKPIKHVI